MQLFGLFTRVDFWIYVMMAVLFITGLIYCIFPVRRNQSVLNRARLELVVKRSDGTYVYDYPEFLNCRSLNECWARFISNLNEMRESNGVCEISDFINSQTVIHIPGHSAYGEMLPGLLTTLGILGSFYGIVQGLSGLDLSTTETMNSSILVLISGMKTAFNTSIVGALLAVIFQLLRRFTISGAEHSMRAFVRACRSEITAQLTFDAAVMKTLNAILDELKAGKTSGRT